MYKELKDAGYVVVNVPEIDVESLKPSFDLLPLDKYLRTGARNRRYSWFAGSPKNLAKLPHKVFYQTEKYEGRPDIDREFDEIDTSVYTHSSFQNIVEMYVSVTGINLANTPIEVHQLRINCGVGFDGDPAPEGVHRDGCHFLGIFIVSRDGLVGGETSVHQNKSDGPIFSEVLQPGQFLFIDDEKLMHYSSPMATEPGIDLAHWDLFVITAGEHRRDREK